MFTSKPMDSPIAKAVLAPMHGPTIEIHLNDHSELPAVVTRSRKPTHCVLTPQYLQSAERIRNLTVYEDDVWILSFPKCGTTWTQEMVWLVSHDLDYATAAEVNLLERSIFLEFSAFVLNFPGDTIKQVEDAPRPRHIQCHLPLALLPRQIWTIRPRLIYCARNPKDATVSFYHHYRHIHGYQGSKEDFLEAMLADQVLFGPQIPHTLDFWTVRQEMNILFIHFEDMKLDMKSVLRRVCKYFGKSYTDDQLSELERHLSFDVMKNNKSANNSCVLELVEGLSGKKVEDFQFMRKGKIGSHQEELSGEYVSRLDHQIETHLAGSDFRFKE
ncbi:luciferin sulfotransferase-like [Anopheles darlingi]|uniref:luciferin sulfotransferase-like n=1 Tax=Anopheles darlingi TaxID=43151 RepID=UPI0021000C20|nr:luciferin sulfotransferase-like [Anopheles darlingi]